MRDVRVTNLPAIAVTNHRNAHVGPEGGAIFAPSPAFVFDTSVAQSRGELAVTNALAGVFFAVEGRQVTAHNLVCGKARDVLGTGIPRHDDTVPIEQTDCVVAQTVGNQRKAILDETQ